MPNLWPVGKHKGTPVSKLPLHFLKWVLKEGDFEAHLMEAVRSELGRRGKTFVDARPVLDDLEQDIEARISDDPLIDPDQTGRITDHLMLGFDAIRHKFNLGERGQDA